jgi:hypothetical protein
MSPRLGVPEATKSCPCGTCDRRDASVTAIRGAFRLLLVLWAGSLWSLAAWVAPTLFQLQSDHRVACMLATRLFTIETYLGLSVALVALILPGRTRFRWVYGAAALLAINEWVLKRLMGVAHARGAAYGLTFGAWHAVSAVLYVAACLAVVLLVWKEDLR